MHGLPASSSSSTTPENSTEETSDDQSSPSSEASSSSVVWYSSSSSSPSSRLSDVPSRPLSEVGTESKESSSSEVSATRLLHFLPVIGLCPAPGLVILMGRLTTDSHTLLGLIVPWFIINIIHYLGRVWNDILQQSLTSREFEFG